MIRVVLDSNVIVAALRSRRGASYKLLSLLGDPRWQPAVSYPLVLEYEAAARRKVSLPGPPDWTIEALVDLICLVGSQHEVYFRVRPALRDPADDFVLELAVASQADFIVTYNLRDFRGCDRWGASASSRPPSF